LLDFLIFNYNVYKVWYTESCDIIKQYIGVVNNKSDHIYLAQQNGKVDHLGRSQLIKIA